MKVWKSDKLPANWFERAKEVDEEGNLSDEKTVKRIITDVRKRGDAALLQYTKQFDRVILAAKSMQVTPEEIKAAYKAVNEDQIDAINLMKDRLESLETQTLRKQPNESSCEGVSIRTVLRPLESVGSYVPGGRATYPSTVVMTATPAKVAGVPRVVVCSPPSEEGTINPAILAAADICGVDEVYKVGGIQAIAALAYGTKTIRPVRKIVGPGSKFVTLAKVLVSKDVGIDLPAGPSEVLVLADETADPKVVAADMISQAEHGSDSVAGLVTPSEKFAVEVREWLENLARGVERGDIIGESISSNGFIIICKSKNELVPLANAFAPEHLEIITKDADEIADKITSAGLILVGPNSPVALSDYAAGTNHVLPTGGFGHVFSGLSVMDFTRRVNIVESTKEGLRNAEASVKVLTEIEGLPNHFKAVEARFEK